MEPYGQHDGALVRIVAGLNQSSYADVNAESPLSDSDSVSSNWLQVTLKTVLLEDVEDYFKIT